MTELNHAVDRLHPRLSGPMREYCRLLRQIGGERVIALTVFGPAVGIDFDPDERPAGNVVVIEQVDLAMLLRLAGHGTRLGKEGIAAPLVMTPTYIKASMDTFPLELLDIQDHHLTIFGSDHFAALRFDPAHVRLQCERELKSVLLAMRQGLLACRGDSRQIDQLEHDAGECLRRTVRGLAWLKGQHTPISLERTLHVLRLAIGQPLGGLGRALDRYEYHDFQDFDALYHDVELLADATNAW